MKGDAMTKKHETLKPSAPVLVTVVVDAKSGEQVNVSEPVLHAFAIAVDCQAQATRTAENSRKSIVSLLLQGAKCGMTVDDYRKLCRADATWPIKDGSKVGDKAARKTPAGDLFNSLSTVHARYKAKDGVLVVEVNEDGEEELIRVGKETREAVKAFEPNAVPPEQRLIDAQQAILDAMNPEMFDRLRPHLQTAGFNFQHLQLPTAKAA